MTVIILKLWPRYCKSCPGFNYLYFIIKNKKIEKNYSSRVIYASNVEYGARIKFGYRESDG